MTITHHIDDATLMSFSAGTLAEPLAAVVACHLDMCAQCRQALAAFDMFGGLMLDALGDLPAPSAVPAVAPVALATPAGPLRRSDGRATGVPKPLQRLIGTSLDDQRWKRLGPGIHYIELPLTGRAPGYLRLMKFVAGLRLPEHGHRGGELTLVLQGGYSDEQGHYTQGDIDDNDISVRHRPVIDADGICISLVAAEAPADYSALLPRLLQPLTGM